MAGEGDRDAVHFLYARYADLVFGLVMPILREQTAAEDLVQSLFTELPRTIRDYDADRAPFAAWLEDRARRSAHDMQAGPARVGEAVSARR